MYVCVYVCVCVCVCLREYLHAKRALQTRFVHVQYPLVISQLDAQKKPKDWPTTGEEGNDAYMAPARPDEVPY